MIILGSIFLLIVGVLMLCFPDVVYCITESWKSNASSEPSGLYKIHIRIGGIACSLVGIAGIMPILFCNSLSGKSYSSAARNLHK